MKKSSLLLEMKS